MSAVDWHIQCQLLIGTSGMADNYFILFSIIRRYVKSYMDTNHRMIDIKTVRIHQDSDGTQSNDCSLFPILHSCFLDD